MECYFCGIGICPELENFLSRSLLGKLGAIITVIDDIYDAYGLIDELKIFTEAIER